MIMFRTIARHTFPLFQGMMIGTVATATLGFAALQGDAFESDPRPTVIFENEAGVRIDPFRHFGPLWHAVDDPTLEGLADALREGPGGTQRDYEDCAVRFSAHRSLLVCPGGYTERW